VQVISVMSMWSRMQPSYAANMWNEALNKRLGTEVYLDAVLPCIYNYMSIFSFIFVLHVEQYSVKTSGHNIYFEV
jgi:hypothetical protein